MKNIFKCAFIFMLVAVFEPSMLCAVEDNVVKPAQDVIDGFQGFLWKEGDKSLPYRLYIPAKLEPGRKYPMVVYLHGSGSIGNDNKKQLTLAKSFTTTDIQRENPCFVLAPQCPEGNRWIPYKDPAGVSYEPGKYVMPKEPASSMGMAMKIVEATIRDYPVDTKRVYVAGPSLGGYATWEIISRMPGTFAAAVPVCGGGDVAQAGKIAAIPIWAFHGTMDPTVKVEQTRVMIEAVKKCGGNPQFTEYPEVKHNAWDFAFKDKEMFKWMFSQVKK